MRDTGGARGARAQFMAGTFGGVSCKAATCDVSRPDVAEARLVGRLGASGRQYEGGAGAELGDLGPDVELRANRLRTHGRAPSLCRLRDPHAQD